MKKNASTLSHVWFLNGGILLIAIVLIGKLGYLQIAQGELYRDKAERQYVVSEYGPFERGTIFFEEKTGRTISAATIVPDYTFAIDPSRVDNPAVLADKIAPIISSFDRTLFITKASRVGDKYEEIKKHLSEEEATRLKGLGDRAIILKKDKKRIYPLGTLAAHVVGFVGSNGETVSGRYGIERYYDEVLAREGEKTATGFFADLFLKAGEAIISRRTREGDVVSTIEPIVQGELERTLAEDLLRRYHATQAMGIIMDPKTGAIYALASAPTFDPNNFSQEKNARVFINPIVEGSYELGSIVKALTVATGLDLGVITSQTTYNDKGSAIYNTKRISNFDGKARGVVPIQEVLNQSLNVGSAFVADRIGKEKFRTYFTQFGLGEETGIDLPNEGVGNIENLSSTRDIEFATASFGQGISVTPIAALRAFSALANGGTLPSPHVVKRIEYGMGSPHDFVPGGERRVLKPATSREITRMLTEAVDTALLVGTLKKDHYSIAAKTGTAQQVVGGKYSETNFLHTFFGYFPSHDPKFIIFLAVQNPQGEQYASHTLSKPFMQIAEFLINYYEIPPDR